jgi:hypothetical protein
MMSGFKVNSMEEEKIITHLLEERQMTSLLEATAVVTNRCFCGE